MSQNQVTTRCRSPDVPPGQAILISQSPINTNREQQHMTIIDDSNEPIDPKDTAHDDDPIEPTISVNALSRLQQEAIDQLDKAKKELEVTIAQKEAIQERIRDLRPEVRRLQVIVNSFTPRTRTVKPKEDA